MADKKLHQKLFDLQGLAIKKDASNPFFKSKYMSLDNILTVLNPLLKDHKLLIFHATENKEVVTTVYDIESDEAVSSRFPLVETNDPQKYGSCITYAKRYNLSQLFNIITDEDDDGNASRETAKEVFNEKPEPTRTDKPEHGSCEKCGADKVLNPKTDKIFCKDKCWLK